MKIFRENIIKIRYFATRLSSVGVLGGSFMTIVQYWRPLQIRLYSLRQWHPMWSPLMELPYATSVRYWRPTWGQRQTFPYSTSLRHNTVFPTCYPKSHPDVGSLPPITHEQQYFFRNARFFSVAHPIKRE